MSRERFDEVIGLVLNFEGGYSSDRNDPGNFRPDGTFGGTKWGISARAYPELNIKDLTVGQAKNIYYKDYWLASGANSLSFGLDFVHFDTAVNSGVGRANQFLARCDGNPYKYLTERLRFMTDLKVWPNFARGWTRRIIHLFEYLMQHNVPSGAAPTRLFHVALDGEVTNIPASKISIVGDKVYFKED
jgi:lysozyme family protein